ncbi:MAG: acetyl/propionyl/methylcrotonyl-CoA carboxylase subunit alpha [Halieaceae bacterium]|jgi:geranyl-CoA carboxylase alpha subunit|nr:acetyl/propionyl/methylcrotonyl-CoA carboxylase subunit alpha [Halieaceae bacterium]
MTAFSKILIANRGEIAVRVIRTARELGYRTVAVYSEADAGALHVAQADQSVCIGPAPVGESYLVAENILDAARRTGADAIHPGYGFLSENADFATQCEEAGLIFIGPSASAIELMGSKRLSKLAMLDAGVPCIPGYQGADQSDETLIAQAQDVGFPLMVKASAGGGGRGMRLVLEAADLESQIRTARSEALNAFGSGELILERAVMEPRHIEIQVFADNHGNVVYLGERDCSIQRRHQKVVEEAPSPFVDKELRQRMGEAAVQAARSCDYRGAGTVEFLVDASGAFYFLEMNTRLQVEHPVTELITGQDLVGWQLQVAAGEPLPLQQEDIKLQGHAVEVRLYAEDPRQQFLPQTGEVLHWHIPDRPGIRVDHGVCQGQAVSPYYDPMLAKIISWGENREQACRKLASAVQDTVLLGVNGNKLFLQNILRHPAFLAGDATTAFIEQHFQTDPSMDQSGPGADTVAIAALIFFAAEGVSGSSWRNSSGARHNFKLRCEGSNYPAKLSRWNDQVEVQCCDSSVALELINLQPQSCHVRINGVGERISYVLSEGRLYLDDGSGHHSFEDVTHEPASAAASAGSGQVRASMAGAIVDVLVHSGERVAAGQTLVVLEAMKMEHPLKAGIDGVVEEVNASPGDQVKARQVVMTVAAEDELQEQT